MATMTLDQTTHKARSEAERFDRASWAILVGVLLVAALSVLLTGYRLSLPTDDREWLDEPEFGLEFGDDAVLTAVDDVPVRDIVAGALTLRPRRPANWAVEREVTYTFQDGTQRQVSLRPSSLVLGAPDHWEWLGIVVLALELSLGTFVFLCRPRSQATRLLFLYGALPVITVVTSLVTNDVSGVRLTDYYYRGAFWPTLLFYGLEMSDLPLLFHFLLVFPSVKRPLRRFPRLTPVLLYASTLFGWVAYPGNPFAFLFGDWIYLPPLLWQIVMFAGIVIITGHTLLNLRRSARRVQMRWVAWAIAVPFCYFFFLLVLFLVVILIAILGLESLVSPALETALETVLSGISIFAFFTFPLFLSVAIWRYRLFGIDVLVNRTLVYGALTGIVVGLYVIVVGALGVLFQVQDSLVVSILVTGVIAALFHPLRERLQRAVNRLMYGERDDPVAVLSRLGQHLEATMPTDSILPTIVETVAQALKLPYAAITLKRRSGFRIAASYGQPVSDVLELPLVYQGDTIGCLILALRAPGEDFSPADRRLLENIAQQAGVATHVVQLTVDLQRSRERLITTREEERRRLRRDLHDGLGPQLASLTLKIDAARNLLTHDSAQANALLLELKDQTQAAIADIRRLVYDLRPPALDQLGLVSALREHVATHNGMNGLRVSIEAPESLPPLPAAVEVAAYRIALEALTNAERHARATSCVVRLTLDDALQLEITDDGVGLPQGYQAGVGLASMRERATELGGTCVVEPVDGGGTRVVARLPVSRETGSVLRNDIGNT